MVSPASWQALTHPFRAFFDDAEALVGAIDGRLALRAALESTQPFSALTFLMMKPPSYRVTYLPEILAAIAHGPSQSLLLARDVLRCLPRADLEDGVPDFLDDLLQIGGEDAYDRLSEVIIELRLQSALLVLRRSAVDHPDDEVRELHRDLEDVENDSARWGRLVSEWPIRDAR